MDNSDHPIIRRLLNYYQHPSTSGLPTLYTPYSCKPLWSFLVLVAECHSDPINPSGSPASHFLAVLNPATLTSAAFQRRATSNPIGALMSP